MSYQSAGWLFAGTLATVVIQRLVELGLSARHTRWIRHQGGIEFGRGHYPWMVALHAVFAASMCLEFLIRSSRGLNPLWPLCLVLLLLAQVLRYSAMAALGPYWNTRVWVAPGSPRVQRGIFRWISHPNYAGVILEFFFLPALFGLWWTAVLFSFLNALILRVRIRAEERALRFAEGGKRKAEDTTAEMRA